MENVMFCSLAVGESYLKNFIDLCNEKKKRDNSKSLAVTDKDTFELLSDLIKENNHIEYVVIEDNYVINEWPLGFNFNLKHLPIKHSIKEGIDFIVYIDSDFRIIDGYHPNKFKNLFDNMVSNDIDYVFERPYFISHGKQHHHDNFWRHKIEPYKLMETSKYDNYHVCNEQFLVFRNSNKMTIFSERWEELYWKSIELNVWTFAEGLEIAMASADAEMTFDFNLFRGTLNNCFQFNDKSGNLHTRF
jgi:hypothetical protein